MFNAIRKTIASFIAPSTQQVEIVKPAIRVTELPYMGKGMSKDEAKKQARTPVAHRDVTAIFGDLSADQITDLGSDRVKSSILQFGAWIALSSAFNLYATLHGNRRPSDRLKAQFELACNTFHQWNSRLDAFSAGLDILEISLRLCIPRAARVNQDTDAILARIRGITVEEVAEKRVETQTKKAKQKEELVEAFVAEIEGYAFGDLGNPTMKAAQCLAKAEEVILWIASWDTPDIAELLIAEQDVKHLRHLAHVAELKEGSGEGSRELDEALLDEGGMRQGSGK